MKLLPAPAQMLVDCDEQDGLCEVRIGPKGALHVLNMAEVIVLAAQRYVVSNGGRR